MTDTYDKTCLTCHHFIIGCLGHVQGVLIVMDYENVPCCIHRGLQVRYIKDHFPKEAKQAALNNLPLPMPANLLGPICGMKYWRERKVSVETAKPEVRK